MLHRVLLHAMPFVPGVLMKRVARRYIAGETLPEAVAALERLKQRGYTGILDILGEHVSDTAEARTAASAYKQSATALAESGLDAYVSIKPTHFGLELDPKLAADLYAEVAAHCRELGILVRVEMEDHPTVDATLEIFEGLRRQYDNVGLVLQSRLFRTPADIQALAPGPLDVRMVKGVYLEPSSIAHTGPGPIRDAFVACSELLLRRDAHVRFATHDQALAARLVLLAQKHDVAPQDYEFQVLLGVRESLWERWSEAGHPVRVYVPFGPEWRAYSQRRMRENPELFKAVLANTFRR